MIIFREGYIGKNKLFETSTQEVHKQRWYYMNTRSKLEKTDRWYIRTYMCLAVRRDFW